MSTHDYYTEQQEEEYYEAEQDELFFEAACYVADGMSIDEAMSHAETMRMMRMDAEDSNECIRDDENNVVDYLDSSLVPPTTKGRYPKEIYAIYQKLLQA